MIPVKKYILSIFLIILCVSVAFTVSADTASSTDGNVQSDDEIISAVLEHFQKLAAIPRPSGHEEKISRYLCEYAEKKGLKPIRDESNNVIVDIPATPGLEKLPKVALQGHMDMVCVADHDGYDPENDPIEVVREGDIIRAKGTSLGADDGIGIAIILCVMDGLMPHGPVRAIFTTDEERGMEGAKALDPSHFDGCTCLINLDSEISDSVTLGCASCSIITQTTPLETVKPAGDTSVTIRVSGLKGGHSASVNNTFHLNAINVMLVLLRITGNNGIPYELASLRGGSAINAIPVSSECEIVISGKDMEKLKAGIEYIEGSVREIYKDVEPDIKIECTENKRLPEKVFNNSSLERILSIGEMTLNGALEVENNTGNPVTSANLGIVETTPGSLTVKSSLRSISKEHRQIALNFQKRLAELNGFTFNIDVSTPIWEYSKINPLRDLYSGSYRKQTGHLPKLITEHGGLECAYFIQAAPDLQLISIGPDIDDAHSVNETCHLPAIVTVWRALAETLAHMDECTKAIPVPAEPSSSSDAV